MRNALPMLVALCGIAGSASAQTMSVPSDTLLAGVTERGRFLAEYDLAAWHATDALMALHPDPRETKLMVGVRMKDGRWIVMFGWLSTTADTFYVPYEAREAGRPDTFTVITHAPVIATRGIERLLAVAIQTGIRAFGPQKRPTNVYVLPRGDGLFWVYLLPAQTQWNVYPHGDDVRYTITADGRTVLETHPMHRALLISVTPDSAVAGVHSVIVDDVPQESCVLLVLTRASHKPEIVATAHYDYDIHPDGSISWRLGQRKSP
jgi:hypothetical protein